MCLSSLVQSKPLGVRSGRGRWKEEAELNLGVLSFQQRAILNLDTLVGISKCVIYMNSCYCLLQISFKLLN